MWLRREEKEELRKQAYELRRTEAAIVREALRVRLGMPAIREPDAEDDA